MEKMTIHKKDIHSFAKALAQYHITYGLRDLPWRNTKNPYYILVSEIMLQQTQVARVEEKYKTFIQTFPTVGDLARAPQSEVLRLWSGLGYNRRAKFLQQCAQGIVKDYKGVVPKTIEELCTLPGIGPYTARAVCAFAYNTPSVLFETNIRTVFIHHFFPNAKEKIADTMLAPYVEKTIDTKNPRVWYWLLMDYGSYLKSIGIKTHTKSTMFTKQKKFDGSLRQVRGGIMKLLIQKPHTKQALLKHFTKKEDQVEMALAELVAENLIHKQGRNFLV